MAIDFYNTADRKHQHLLFQLYDADQDSLKDVLKEYNRLTGLYLEPYKDTRIHQDHINLLIRLISKHIVESADSRNFDAVRLHGIIYTHARL
ncbi:hypothetical protein [Mucilaginibacter sp.]